MHDDTVDRRMQKKVKAYEKRERVTRREEEDRIMGGNDEGTNKQTVLFIKR